MNRPSARAAVLAAGTPGKRMALPGARIVIQHPAIEEPVRDRPRDLDVHAEELRQLPQRRSVMVRPIARHTGRDAGRITGGMERCTVFDAPAARTRRPVDLVLDSSEPFPSTPAG
ncbi:ATP-dependent Clp protease proteolytic subunit [Streptomyces sp. NBC_00344]|uniref:ATP-dependent Clp protease proteolytic subunit n=1 Tax=Streptomyces sp. NBC_00344 TaxID=2975720 RepID=UPI002E1B4BFF